MSLNKKPGGKFQLATDQAGLERQQQRWQKRLDSDRGNKKRQKRRLRRINKALGALGNAPDETANVGFGDITQQSNQYLGGLFEQMQGQGQFNPGSYQDMRQQATDTAMSEFDRLNQSRFANEDEAFYQRMAEQGIPQDSEKFQKLNQERMMNRNSAIQGAQNQAFQLGQGEQQQAFNQAATKYRMPMEQMQSVAPFYGYQHQANLQQGQQDFQTGLAEQQFGYNKELADLQNQYRLQQIAATPRGGGSGALSFEQQKALIDHRFYNDLVSQGLAQNQGGGGPGFAGGAAAGLGAGAQIGLGAGLR